MDEIELFFPQPRLLEIINFEAAVWGYPRRLYWAEVNTDYMSFGMLTASIVNTQCTVGSLVKQLTYSAMSIAQIPVPVPKSKILSSFFGSFTTCNAPSRIKLVAWCIMSILYSTCSQRPVLYVHSNAAG